jgi:amino-acid N-acetyltransferase
LLRAGVLFAAHPMTSSPDLRLATDRDADSIRHLLEGCRLPTSDLATARPEFIVACDAGKVIATAALERFGSTALVRSVAVAPEWRGSGTGPVLVAELERIARTTGITELVLLTQTAATFFARLGFTPIDRNSVASALQASEEFRSLCPASATCMSKALR